MSSLDRRTVDRVRERLAAGGGDLTPAKVAAAISAEGILLGDSAVLTMVDTLRREMVGAGPVESLLRIEGVTDVLVNGPAVVYIDDGHGLRRTAVTLSDDRAVRRLAQRLAATAGRRLDDASPYVDVRLADGTRLHAILSPPAQPGTCLSFRVPARRDFTLESLAATGFTGSHGLEVLRRLVCARVAFVVTGGTGSGKTTLLAALLAACNPAERLVIVEDSAELRPRHPHVVSLEARPANVEGEGEISLRTLVRQALRMRPDRLVVGEVRGAEVVDLLAALNTGHQGGCGTVHANSAHDVPARFEALGIAAGLSRAAVHAQLTAAVDVVCHLARGSDGTRRLAELAVVESPHGEVIVVPALTFAADGTPITGTGFSRLATLLDLPRWLMDALGRRVP
jgi:pilus assembly protein CpaF